MGTCCVAPAFTSKNTLAYLPVSPVTNKLLLLLHLPVSYTLAYFYVSSSSNKISFIASMFVEFVLLLPVTDTLAYLFVSSVTNKQAV